MEWIKRVSCDKGDRKNQNPGDSKVELAAVAFNSIKRAFTLGSHAASADKAQLATSLLSCGFECG